jgi:putative ABC transport system permease protein
MTSRGGAGEGTPSPGLLRRLLRLAAPAPERDVVDGELSEGFRLRASARGLRNARRWYRRQVWGYMWRMLLVRRVTEGRGRATMRLDDVGADIRWALRSLRKRPGFTLVAIATLALGIGANSAIFTLVEAHFFESLPYEDPDGLVLLWETGRNNLDVNTVSPGSYWTWYDEAESFSGVAAYNVDFATLSGDGAAEQVTASYVVPHFFDVLGVEPMLGPGFDEASVREADEGQVVLGYSLWTRRYGADPAIVGRDIRVDGRSHTVVGVMPRAYRQPERSLSWQTTELWRPMLLEGGRTDHGSRFLRTVARRRPGVTVEQARAEVTAIAARLAGEYPESNAGRTALVRTLDEYLMADARPTLIMLLFAGGAVLLIVCANVANLTLARGEERRREFAVRAALGSGRGRLLRQIIVESVVLSIGGAALGTILVWTGGDALQRLQTRFFSGLVDVSVDLRIVAATTALAVVAGVLFGLPLARSAARTEIGAALVEGGRGGSARSEATRGLLIVGQVGLATGLLVVAALLVRSFSELVAVPPGFEASGVAMVTVSPPSAAYSNTESVVGYHRALLERVEAIPGVREVGMVSDLMFTTENMYTTFTVDGRTHDPENPPRAEYQVATPEYFSALTIPVLEGGLPEPWSEGEEVPAVVNERMAATFWPDGDAVGSRFTLEWSTPIDVRVVAVVGNVLDDGFDAAPEPIFYVPFSQMPRRRMSYLVRAQGDAAELLPALRGAVDSVDPDIPAGNLRLLEGMMAESVARPRAASLLGLMFALVALLVAAAGIYGVLSYAVQRRTREIGIRSALGASGRDLVGMIMGQSTRLVVLGLLLGSLGAIAAGRALSGLLFGVRSWDPPSLIGAAVVLGAVATLAAWLPARRAVAVDPREALRAE